jgi:hypothetical protein
MLRQPVTGLIRWLSRPLPPPPAALRRGPLREGAFPSALRSQRLTSQLGIAVGLAFVVCFVTGLLSHLIQHPPAWFAWPSRPVHLYRVTQGVHVAAGLACVPLLAAKLWSAYPRLFRWPPVRDAAHALERASVAVLVAAAHIDIGKWFRLGLNTHCGLFASGSGSDPEVFQAGSERMRLAGEGGQGGGDGLQVGLDVCGGRRAGLVGVPGVGAGDPVAEVAFHPGQRGVPQPVGGDTLSGNPWQPVADALPQVVVAPRGQRAAVAVTQQLIRRCDGTAVVRVVDQMGGQVEADRLPAQRFALLTQPNESLIRIEVGPAQRERAPAPAGRLGVQAQQQRIENRVVAARPCHLVYLGQFPRCQRAARVRQPTRLLTRLDEQAS